MKKALFLLLSGLTFYLAGFYHSPALMQLFLVLLLLGACLFLCSQYAVRALEVRVALDGAQVYKGGALKGSLVVVNHGRLPITQVVLRLSGDLCAEACAQQLCAGVAAGAQQTIPFEVCAQYCGVLRVTLEQVRAYDALGVFCGRKRIGTRVQALVLPAEKAMRIAPAGMDQAVWQEQPAPRAGDQPPDIYQIDAYRPGDAMRNIHWKLSARQGTLMSKRYSAQQRGRVALRLDAAGLAPDVRARDAFLEVASALSLGLLQLQMPHDVYMAGDQGAYFSVETPAGYRQMIAALVGRVCADEALPSPQVGARALDQPCFELDAGLALHWQGRVLAQFTPDDCISQMERRCLFV
nr:DUF58 domain-containing protein [Maliibacterium massiliense]